MKTNRGWGHELPSLLISFVLSGSFLSGFAATQKACRESNNVRCAVTSEWPHSQTFQTSLHTGTQSFTEAPEVWRATPHRAPFSWLGHPCTSTPAGKKIIFSNPLYIQTSIFVLVFVALFYGEPLDGEGVVLIGNTEWLSLQRVYRKCFQMGY